jgi:NhaP-type Na+/H+ or K+/H+ antiporter
LRETLLIGLAGILILGVGAQWLAWRLRIPSILLLLLFGFIAGPVTGFLEPDQLLGLVLFPIVSLAVALILFEGGLTLRWSELPQIGPVLFRLISIGALITWVVATLAARFVVGLDWNLAILLGAILIVTGPTVVGPLLRQVKPRGRTGAILKWEGILIDPIGAVLTVLVFEIIRQGEFSRAPGLIAAGVLLTILIGVGLGLLGAAIMVGLLRQYWVPDYLQNAVSLMLVVALFAASNALVPESGLLTVIIMGLALANQRLVSVRHIIEFKESLQSLLLGFLFIVLAARLEINTFLSVGWPGLIFLAILIVIGRPLGAYLSSFRSGLNRSEQLFIAAMAPRGIVAAAISSIFAFELEEAGVVGAEQLVPLTFLVIVGTVTFYGLTAGPLARALGLSEENPQGVLIAGADRMGREMAAAIQEQGFRVVLLDNNWRNIRAGQTAGLETHYGSAISEDVIEELDLGGIGRLLALTANDEVNSLATLLFPEVFGRAEVYQLPIKAEVANNDQESVNNRTARHLRGRILFGSNVTYDFINERLANGGAIKATSLTDDFEYEDYQAQYHGQAIPLFGVTDKKRLIIYTTDNQPVPRPGMMLISLVPPVGGVGDGVYEEATQEQIIHE